MDHEKEIGILKCKTNDLQKAFRSLNTTVMILGIAMMIHMVAHIIGLY